MTVRIPEPERFRSQAYTEIIDEVRSKQTCVFTAETMDKMQTIAEQGYPLEVCGLLVGTSDAKGWCITDIRQVRNLNQERAADRFQLDPEGYQRVDKELRDSNQEIVGVFHSHPDCPAKPSPTDLTSAWEGFVYPIISVCQGQTAEVHCWLITDDVLAGGRFQKLPHQA